MTARDYSLYSGERQTARTLDAVRSDHRQRYEWAASRLGLCPGQTLLDVFSGTGYGAWLVAGRTGANVVAVDGSAEAIGFAKRHYRHPGVQHIAAQWPAMQFAPQRYDAIVCFESLEHIEDHQQFARDLIAALTPSGRLFVSVPCESVIPCRSFGNRFHVRHYEIADVVALFDGLSLVTWLGQPKDGPMRVETVDRTLVIEFRRDA